MIPLLHILVVCHENDSAQKNKILEVHPLFKMILKPGN